MNYEARISGLLAGLLQADPFGMDVPPAEVESWLERPKDPKMGDYAFPCFRLAKQLKKAPPQIAATLREALDDAALKDAGIASVEVAGPYLNFRVARDELAAAIIPAILDGSFTARREASAEKGTTDKVMVEYSQPNTHKAFHVGHFRNVSLGDSLGRLLEWIGHEVVPVNYIGDEGTHVAKCLWHLRTRHVGEIPTEHRGEFLGVQYSTATELLSLDTLTRAPVPGVRAARVAAVEKHPANDKWFVATVEVASASGGTDTRTVVVGAGGFAGGDLVGYAEPGMRVAGKEVGVVDRKGVESTGMLLSDAEMGLSDDNDRIAVLPTGTPLGTEVAEVFRREGAVPDGVAVLEEFKKRNAEVSEILQAIESGEGEIWEQWRQTKDWSMEEFRRIYDWADARFDHWFFESELGEESKEIVREYQKKGMFVESEGAVGADLKEYGLGFCVLIKRDGTALYATRDLALARRKFDEFGIDRSLYVVDDAQTLHFKQVFKCLELMGYEQAAKCFHLGYAQVVLPDGKMSSRKGNVILFSQLEERLLAKIRSEFLDKYKGEWPDEEIDAAAHRIALATIRYGMLNQINASKIVFDLDAWTERSGNTGPYLMYAYARTRSILREVGDVDESQIDWSLLDQETESDLLGHLADYPAQVERAVAELSPQIVCVYAYELCKRFSRWYHQGSEDRDLSVKNAPTDALRATRLQLVDATGRVIQHALSLLGISTIERM